MKNIIKSIIFSLAVFAFVITFSSGVYAKAKYTVTPNKLTSVVKSTYSNFYNEYIKDYAGLNLYLDKLQKAGGGTLTIKKGTYTITNSIYVPSNVTIIFEDGVVFEKTSYTGKSDLKATSAMWQLCPRNKSKTTGSIGKYDGTKNAKLIAKGEVVFDMNGVKGVTIIAAHNQNIEISGITFKGMNGGHYIELNGTKNAHIHDCKFKKAYASTLDTYYVKEAINIDLADKKTGGLSATWVKQDKTPCNKVLIENNRFYGTGRAVGSHKYSQNSKGKNIYHKNITIRNNVFKDNYDNGIYVLSWKNTKIQNNKFYNIGNKSKKPYSAGSHAISGGGVEKITITGNKFQDIKRNPIYFVVETNTGGGSEYKPIKVKITKKETKLMCNNTAIDCGYDVNPIFKGYDILYFRKDSQRTRENGVGIKLKTGKIYYGIPKK